MGWIGLDAVGNKSGQKLAKATNFVHGGEEAETL